MLPDEKISAVMALMKETSPEQAWLWASRSLLSRADGFDLHRRVYECCSSADMSLGPLAAWCPTADEIERANVTDAARQVGCGDFAEFQRWSVAHRARYWALALERLGIVLDKPHSEMLDASDSARPVWLSGARMNIVRSCFGGDPGACAIRYGDQDGSITEFSYGELQGLVARVANSLMAAGVKPGNAVAILLPMTPNAIAIYLAIIALGASVVSIAESFAAPEIAARLRIASATLVFTQDVLLRGGKPLPLYEKVIAAEAPPAIVLPSSTGEEPALGRAGDISWASFLGDVSEFDPVSCGPQDAINILFSSGTTGEPKAIPWDHTTPIKCAADAHFHHDAHAGDVLCWPTSLGWMMGPWLVFAALINRATIAVSAASPVEAGFGRFVEVAGVTMLGVVPSLVRAWHSSGCMEPWDWGAVRAFSSTGECSSASEMLYLMFLGGYKPVIEYCGGTEIGGAYLTGSVVQPCAPATFTTPALGMELACFGPDHQPANPGELFLRGPSLGLSTRLLNRDHEAAYYQDTPPSSMGDRWRRHGDEVEELPGRRYRMLGRCDDTMNLGGIKVSNIEVEQVLDRLEEVSETAAVAAADADGGPSRLVVYAVLERDRQISEGDLMLLMQQALRDQLNPLFRISAVRLLSALPRTASNKILRRELRAQCL